VTPCVLLVASGGRVRCSREIACMSALNYFPFPSLCGISTALKYPFPSLCRISTASDGLHVFFFSRQLLSAKHRDRFIRFYRAMLSIRGTSHVPLSVCVRLCLCLSVTSRCSTKTAKRRITQTTPHDTPGSLVFWCQRSPRNSTGVTPYEGAECKWVVNIGDFRQITGYISKTVKDRHIFS